MSSWRLSEGPSEGFWLDETEMSAWRSSEGPSKGFWLDNTKMSSWRSSEALSEGFWLDETKMSSWRSSEGPSEGFWLDETKNLVCMTMRPTCRPARLIWLEEKGNLSYILGHFWLDDPMDLSCWNAYDWLIRLICFKRLLLASLSRDFRKSYAIDKKTITRKRLLLATNTPFWSVLDARNRQNECHICLLTLPVVE